MNGSKRKQLAVPMVALMVCAVAFIGIGYALSSTATNTGNGINGFDIEVKLTSDGSNLMGSGSFKTNATIEQYSTQTNSTITYKIDETRIGTGKLVVNATSTNNLTLSYSVTIKDSNGSTINIPVKLKSGENVIENNSRYTPVQNGDALDLYVYYSGENPIALTATLTYDITFTVTKG